MPTYFYQNGKYVQARHSLPRPAPKKETWRLPPSTPLYTPATGKPQPRLSSYRVRPVDQPSSVPAWDAPWGWNHGRLGGAGQLTPLHAARDRLMNSQLHARFARH